MTKKQKQFVIEELIPYILREEGRGFAMSIWIRLGRPDIVYDVDGAQRNFPSCGTIACIGGSVAMLQGLPCATGAVSDMAEIGSALGLTITQAYALCHTWLGSDPILPLKEVCRNRWPRTYRARYADAKTTHDKATVAADLLRLVAETDGHCLDDND